MWSYIIDGLLILIILVCIVIGISKGLFDSIIGLVGTSVSLVASVLLGKHVANFINKIFGFEQFIYEKLSAPDVDKNEDGFFELFNDTFSNKDVAKFCVWICSVVILFLCILIVIHIIGKLFEAVVNTSPTISGVNRVLGMIFGALRGGAIVAVLLALCSVLAQVPVIGQPLYDNINNTKITSGVFKYVDEFVEKKLTKENIQDLIDKITSELEESQESGEQIAGSGDHIANINTK
jgi:uncharacterized membrane protein required for colicin V production